MTIWTIVDTPHREAQYERTEEIDEFRALIESLENEGFTERSDIETLKAEIQQLEEEVKKLRASSEDAGGISGHQTDVANTDATGTATGRKYPLRSPNRQQNCK